MQIQTHILAGWCLGNSFQLTARERLLCMIAAEIADLDGIGIISSIEAYLDYHHVLGHNVFVGILIVVVLSMISRRLLMVPILTLSFASHLVLDSFGSGEGWGLSLFYPLSDRSYVNPYAWSFQGWENSLAMFCVLFPTVVIGVKHRRTPFEAICPRLEAKIYGVGKIESY